MSCIIKIFNAVLFARACVFREAYLAEVRSGGNSKFIAAGLVGVFDSPLIMFFLLLLDTLLFDGEFIRQSLPANISSVSSLLYAIFVFTLEYLYYEIFNVGMPESFYTASAKKIKIIGMMYAITSLLGGGFMIFLILKFS